MAARLWLCALLATIGIGAATAWVLVRFGSLPLSAALASALLLSGAVPWLLAAVASIAARVLQSRAPPRSSGADSVPSDAWAVARAILTEGAAMWRIVLAMSAAPARRADSVPRSPARSGARTQERPRPVLLIHGVLCNGAVWHPLMRRLRDAGFAPLRALDLEPLAADIERYAEQTSRAITDLQRRSSGERVAIVAHSLGGLVARAALRTVGASAIGRIITIATPHHGTAIARWLPLQSMRQIRPDSPWLVALDRSAADAACDGAVAITSLYSLDDELVVPAVSAALEGASNIALRGVGHLGLLGSTRAIARIVAALESR